MGRRKTPRNSSFSSEKDHQLVMQRKLEKQLADGQVSMLNNIRAICQEGTERAGHGVVLTIQAKSSRSFRSGMSLKVLVDIHGSSVFSVLPSGLGVIAQSILPYEIMANILSVSDRNVTIKIGVGLSQLSRNRVDRVLGDIINAGDDPFVVEFRDAREDKLIGFLPTKASLLKESLESKSDIFYDETFPIPKPKGMKIQYMKFLKCMLLFAFAVWYLYFHEKEVLSYVPSYSRGSFNISNLSDVLPLHPTNMSAAFQMGALQEQLNQEYLNAETFQRPVDEQTVQMILQKAALLGGKSITEGVTELQLRNALAEIVRVENHVSVITKVRGFFNFVNCMWLFSIMGISISIGPTLYSVSQPIRHLIIRLSKYFAYEIMLPFLVRLHSWGIIEINAYALCWFFIVEGFRLKHDAGVMVALTGYVLCIPCVFYSVFLWGRRIARKWKSNELMQIAYVWLIITWIPSAIHFQSTLLGYGVVIAFFCIMGLDARVYPLLIMVGFESEENALRCAGSSFVLVVLQTVLRLFDLDHSPLLNPFASATGVIGNNVFFLSMLILSFSSNYEYLFNSLLACALLSFNLVGHILHLPGMSTVAVTYSVLSAMMKYSQFHVRKKFNIWFLVLIMSVVIWRLSLFLHLNPQYITCLFGA